MEAAGPINQEPARIKNVVSEVRPNVCNELGEGHAPKLQSVANQSKRIFRQNLTFALGKSDQVRLRRRWEFCVGKPFLMMMIGVCSSRLHFSRNLPCPVTDQSADASEGGSRASGTFSR